MKGERRFLLAAVGLLAVAIPLSHLTPVPHPGGDNAGYLTLAHSLLERGAYLDLWDLREPVHTKYPPVFPLLLAVPMALGVSSWWGFKAVPFLFTVLSLLLFHAWCSRRQGPRFAAGATILLALSPAVLHASRWILSEPPFLAFTLLALIAAEGVAPLRGRSRDDDSDGGPRGLRLLVVTAAVLLAFSTRSAGLPLVGALLLWIWAQGGRRQLLPVGAAIAVPGLLWWIRSRRAGDTDYISEFWMLDPYRPELGSAGALDLLARIGDNAREYVFTHLPAGLFPLPGPWLPVAGILLIAVTAAGWAFRVRRGPGLPEFFLPLYAGLLLLWPVVWAGDRFALPLYPLILYYGGLTVLEGFRRVRASYAVPAAATLFALLMVPGVLSWWSGARDNFGCLEWARTAGPLACHPTAVQEFGEAARWVGESLPPGSGVLSRNPRLFFVLSGQSGQVYPLTSDPDRFLAEADSLGAGIVVVDRLTALADRYVLPAIGGQPTAYCYLADVGGGMGTQILGVLPPADRTREGGSPGDDEEGVYLRTCPADRMGGTLRPLPPPHSFELPFLARSRPGPRP